MVNAGTIPNTNPPGVPLAWKPITYIDGFTYEQLGDQLVCQPRTDIPGDHTQPSTPEVAQTDVVNVPQGDTRPVGSIVSGLELLNMGASAGEVGTPGSRWKKCEKGGPFGVWRWYQRQ